MKHDSLICGLLSILTAVGCSVDEQEFSLRRENTSADECCILSAVIDEEDATKTYIDANLNILWNQDDRLTVFYDATKGVEWRFLGNDGDPDGDFEKIQVQEDENILSGGTDLGGDIVAVYPYSPDTKILQNETITYKFPATQTYRENSFGPGANVMVAHATQEDKLLRFKNAMGYLSFKLWGEDVHVSSVILKANGGEALAGKGTIVVQDGVPAVAMDESESVDKVRLYCGDVLLGSSAEDCTEFWFALPPVSFTRAKGGFTIVVTTIDGRVFRRSAPMDLEIKRKTVERMNSLKVVPVEEPGGTLNSVSSPRNDVSSETVYEADREGDTFLLTLPTVTDFSKVVLNFDIDGDMLMADGEEITSGITPVDLSEPQTLVVCKGDVEKPFTLTARNTGLPVVRITTSGFSLEDLESYENSLQSSDKLDHRIWLPETVNEGTTVRIEYPDGTAGMNKVNKDGSKNPVYEVVTQVKGRGNYTWKWDKKAYALKLDGKREVLGMPAHKRWVLLANWRDRTLLRNDAAFWLSKQSGLPYTTRGHFVELEINGQHRGNYYLCEQIKIDANRVNITPLEDNFEDLTGGYLMEIDSYWDELNKFKSAKFNLNYMFKEPDDDPAAAPEYAPGYAWMQAYINEFETVLKTKNDVANKKYEDYLDVDSAIMFMLLNELTGNRDFFQGYPNFGPHSTYLYKDKGGKLFMGPIWDFDYETFIPAKWYSGGSYKWRGFDNTGYYYYYLCYNQEFVDRIKALWSLRKEAFLGLTAHIDEMADLIRLSQQFDEENWPFHNEENRNDNHDYTLDYQAAIDLMKESFQSRVTWMDSKISSLKQTNPFNSWW